MRKTSSPTERSEGGPPQAGGPRAGERYSLYLTSPLWKTKRGAALRRDGGTCRACGERAEVVHHVQYPKVLGEEPLEWLYSMCVPCHDTIHRLVAQKHTSIRKATFLVLDEPPKPRSKSNRKRAKLKKPKPSKRTWAKHTEKPSRSKQAKRELLAQENNRLHAIQARNRQKGAR